MSRDFPVRVYVRVAGVFQQECHAAVEESELELI